MNNFYGMEMYALGHGSEGDGHDLGDTEIFDGVYRNSLVHDRVGAALAADGLRQTETVTLLDCASLSPASLLDDAGTYEVSVLGMVDRDLMQRTADAVRAARLKTASEQLAPGVRIRRRMSAIKPCLAA